MDPLLYFVLVCVAAAACFLVGYYAPSPAALAKRTADRWPHLQNDELRRLFDQAVAKAKWQHEAGYHDSARGSHRRARRFARALASRGVAVTAAYERPAA
ncbi:hypothetical protein [Microbacterium sp. B24]|uniref:hypothetical protein n=1 Tax=Microbacterium sp. B24 TaxID=95616 RepID=UPI0004018EF4|nr:hypothetical protein [Microbacterium sp. B24]